MSWFKCTFLKLSKHKCIEFQISRWNNSPIFALKTRRRKYQDHPGFEVCLTLFRHEFRVDYYDNRHLEDIVHNPYFEEYQKLPRDTLGFVENFRSRPKFVDYYSYAIPSPEALQLVAKYSPLIEIGAGNGYWVYCLKQLKVDIKAFDSFRWETRWKKIWDEPEVGTEKVLLKQPNRNLFLCWPLYDDPMAYNCLRNFMGKYVVYIGEPSGGCTADDKFFEELRKNYTLVEELKIPQWECIQDRLFVYKRN